jgi:lysylphosphatidylglycerol synthetase-like protein (DUF2156 family)
VLSLRRILDAAARIPFTIVYLAAVGSGTIALWLSAGMALSARRELATGFEPLALWGHWWSPVTSLLVADDAVGLVLALGVGAVALGISERRMGTGRTVIAFFATAIAADVVGATLQAVLGYAGGMWDGGMRASLVLDPLTGVAGAVMTASAFATARTRRRMRVLTVVVTVMFLLYRGEPVDVYRSLAVVVGLVLGLALRPGSRTTEWARSSHHEVRVFMASVVSTGAVGPVIAAMSRHPHGLLAPIAMLLDDGSPVDPAGLRSCSVYAVSRACMNAMTLERIGSVGPIVLSVLPLLVLVVVTWGLARGRRFAWGLGVGMNVVLAVCAGYYLGFLPHSGLPGVDVVPHRESWGVVLTLGATVVAPTLTAILLLSTRRSFTVPPPPRAVRRYLGTVTGTALALVVAYMSLGWVLRTTAFDGPVSVADLAFDAVERFVPVEFLHREIPDFLPSSKAGAVLYHGVGPVFWAVVVIAAIPPLVARAASSTADAQRARRILQTHGGDHIAFMTTWPLTSYWFGADGETAIGYRLVGGVAITIGAAFGKPDAVAEAMTDFARHCDDHGWTPAFYSIDAGDWDAHFAAIGWDRLVIAEEAVIDAQGWSPKGRRFQDIRTAVNRARRDGLGVEWTSWNALSRETAAQLADISEEWVAGKELPEMGFTLGGLDELRDRDVALMIARASDGTVQAATSWMPGYRDGRVDGWTLDFMRRRTDGPNGVMEYLIAATAERARDDGLSFVSLSAAPLARSAGSDAGQGTLDRVLRLLASSLEAMYAFGSLLAFKRKFQPELRPLLLAYPDPAALPAIGLALARAYLPGFTVRDAVALLRRQ